MALAPSLATTLAQAFANQVTIAMDAGTVGGIISIYDGTPPATADTALSANNLLATVTCSDPCFGAASDAGGSALITANAITADTNAAATGTASFFRAYQCSTSQIDANKGAVVIQGSVGTATSDLILDSVAIVAAGTVDVTAWTINVPDV